MSTINPTTTLNITTARVARDAGTASAAANAAGSLAAPRATGDWSVVPAFVMPRGAAHSVVDIEGVSIPQANAIPPKGTKEYYAYRMKQALAYREQDLDAAIGRAYDKLANKGLSPFERRAAEAELASLLGDKACVDAIKREVEAAIENPASNAEQLKAYFTVLSGQGSYNAQLLELQALARKFFKPGIADKANYAADKVKTALAKAEAQAAAIEKKLHDPKYPPSEGERDALLAELQAAKARIENIMALGQLVDQMAKDPKVTSADWETFNSAVRTAVYDFDHLPTAVNGVAAIVRAAGGRKPNRDAEAAYASLAKAQEGLQRDLEAVAKEWRQYDRDCAKWAKADKNTRGAKPQPPARTVTEVKTQYGQLDAMKAQVAKLAGDARATAEDWRQMTSVCDRTEKTVSTTDRPIADLVAEAEKIAGNPGRGKKKNPWEHVDLGHEPISTSRVRERLSAELLAVLP